MSADFEPTIPGISITPLSNTESSISVQRTTYNQTGSFRFWCQKVLPLVYDDSLSYYELLCKVVNFLNEVIENVDNLHDENGNVISSFNALQTFVNTNDAAMTAFINSADSQMVDYINDSMDSLLTAYNQLQGFVNDYFDNLDVQEEINNKLDGMVEDGTFETLFAPYLTGYQTQLDLLDARLDNLESNIPSGGTSADAELIDIRVGYNAVTYDTAGNAVRNQVSDIHKRLDNKVNGFINLYNPYDEDVETGGYYTYANVWESYAEYMETGYIPVDGSTDYISSTWNPNSSTNVIFFDENKEFISGVQTISNNIVTTPATARYMRISLLMSARYTAVVSKGRVKPPNNLIYNKQQFVLNGKGDEYMEELISDFTPTPYATAVGFLKKDGTVDPIVSGTVLKYNNLPSRIYLHGTCSVGTLYCAAWLVKNNTMVDYFIGGIYSGTPAVVLDGKYIDVPDSTYEVWIYKSGSAPNNHISYPSAKDSTARSEISEIANTLNNDYAIGQQWNGKTWYCYGTSISNINVEGKYPTYLAQLSKMNLVCKGLSGSGIGNLGAYSHGQVYNAICNITDGKLDADLITLETGANDVNASVPLGTIYDTGQSTLAGCLNDCIRYLQANTDAQIAIICSPATTIEPNAENQYYEWASMVEQICNLNRVHYLNNNCNMGYGKLSSSKGSSYVADTIHQTNLGGFIMAQNMWYQLRNIPLFYTVIPS